MIRSLIIFLLRIYQMTISNILPHSCRFYPSCSEYSVVAFKQYGVAKGMLLSIKRILRCNPFFVGGYDPVPTHFSNPEATESKWMTRNE
ncbi:MAG: membrane protein insertion efficiency factor YidD [bacterium]|nr:membrane protein insertion efficiency factor YidD [candidate division WOR-3 bacterium]